jgi:CBS domain-containing protein
MTSAERKVLLVCGAAAGMSAVFSTPVAAILFAVELLLFEWKPRSFIPVAVASLVASVVRIPLLGAGPIFGGLHHAAPSLVILLSAAGLGLWAGLISGLLTKFVYAVEDWFQDLPIHWMWWPALGAVVVGLGGILDPRVLGVGYENIGQLLHGSLIGRTVCILVLVKAIVWVVALGSGTSGGVLAPLLIIGGSLGAMAAGVLPAGDAGLWSLIGMAAMMGGTMRAPFTATLFALELTQDYQVLPALLLASVTAMGVTVLWMKRSILTEKLARRGQHITREYSIDHFELMRVSDVMDQIVPQVEPSITVSQLARRITDGDPVLARRQGTLVVDSEGRLLGIVTREDILHALTEDPEGNQNVLAAASTKLIVAHADESLHDALDRMLTHDIGRLPVVSRSRPDCVVGYLGRASILSARLRHVESEQVRERVWPKPKGRKGEPALANSN